MYVEKIEKLLEELKEGNITREDCGISSAMANLKIIL